MKKSAGLNATTPSQEQIAERARTLWEGYGRPTGRDKAIWLEAERQLLGVDPSVEGSGDIAVSAGHFDEATRQRQPATRLGKPKVKTQPKPARARTPPPTTPPPQPPGHTPPPTTPPPARPVARQPVKSVAPVAKKTAVKKPLSKKPSVKKR
jgi:hypothetical protein